MIDMNTIYYLIEDHTVAKRVKSDGIHSKEYIFRNGKWIEDKDSVVMDHLYGFDPSEPKGSPYRFGNGSILREMKEISKEEAVAIMNRQMSDMHQ